MDKYNERFEKFFQLHHLKVERLRGKNNCALAVGVSAYSTEMEGYYDN